MRPAPIPPSLDSPRPEARRLRRLRRRHVQGLSVPVADDPLSRLLGLAGLPPSAANGLYMPRCSAVHTFGMRFPLELRFLDELDRCLETLAPVPPGRFLRRRGARAVLELPHPQERRHVA